MDITIIGSLSLIETVWLFFVVIALLPGYRVWRRAEYALDVARHPPLDIVTGVTPKRDELEVGVAEVFVSIMRFAVAILFGMLLLGILFAFTPAPIRTQVQLTGLVLLVALMGAAIGISILINRVDRKQQKLRRIYRERIKPILAEKAWDGNDRRSTTGITGTEGLVDKTEGSNTG